MKPAAEGGVTGSLRVIELLLVAFIMIFSASGLIPLLDLVFPAATSYLLALSRLVFPTVGKSGDQSMVESYVASGNSYLSESSEGVVQLSPGGSTKVYIPQCDRAS